MIYTLKKEKAKSEVEMVIVLQRIRPCLMSAPRWIDFMLPVEKVWRVSPKLNTKRVKLNLLKVKRLHVNAPLLCEPKARGVQVQTFHFSSKRHACEGVCASLMDGGGLYSEAAATVTSSVVMPFVLMFLKEEEERCCRSVLIKPGRTQPLPVGPLEPHLLDLVQPIRELRLVRSTLLALSPLLSERPELASWGNGAGRVTERQVKRFPFSLSSSSFN